MSDTKHYSRGHLLSIISAIVCLLAASLILVNRQYVIDQLSVWQYQPSSDIAALAERTSMNDGGRFLFYAAQPEIEDAREFNQKCDRKEHSTAILGCYNGRNIYIYNVTDKRLDGIKEVTAAHEMLHVAYGRMSDDEKRTVDALLEAEYDKVKHDKEFNERMAFYARTEPGERGNELHSVIGTEVADISSKLEDHYKEYFADRGKVVALHARYASVFAELQRKSDALSAQLTQLGDEIEAERAQYNTDVAQLNADIESFNSRANDGGFASQSQFQTQRETLIDRVDQLDVMRQTIDSKIDQYNALRQELLAVAGQTEGLNRSIDSSLAPAPSL